MQLMKKYRTISAIILLAIALLFTVGALFLLSGFQKPEDLVYSPQIVKNDRETVSIPPKESKERDNATASTTQLIIKEKQPLPKEVRGAWMPALSSEAPIQIQSMANPDVLKNDGFNTVAFGPTYRYYKNGKFNPESVRNENQKTIRLIREYKKSGFIVFISSQTMEEGKFGEPGPFSREIIENTSILNELELLVVDLAKIAEAEGVEMFSPLNEPDYRMGMEKASEWSQKILPKIKASYKGKIVWKGALQGTFDPNVSIDFRGYDVIGFSTSPVVNLSKYRIRVQEQITVLKDWQKRDNISLIMITEIGAWSAPLLSEDEFEFAHKLVLEEGKGKVDGFVILDMPGFGPLGRSLRGSKAETAIRDFFTRR